MSFAVARLLPVYRGIALENTIDLFIQPLWWHSHKATSGVIATNRMYKGGIGAELLTNPTFSAWAADAPTGWTETDDTGATQEVTERDPDQLHADTKTVGGAANIFNSSAASNKPGLRQSILTMGDAYRILTNISQYGSGTLQVLDGAAGFFTNYTTAGQKTLDAIAANALLVWRLTGTGNATLDEVSCKKIGELDGALAGGVTLAQTGKLGANHAFAIDGSTGLATVYQQTAINGLAAGGLWFLINPDTLGNGDRLALKSDELDLYLNADGSVVGHVDYDTQDAETSSAAGAVSAGAWQAVGMTWNNTAKRVDLWVNGALVNDTVQAGSGTRVSNTNHLLLYKDSGSNGFDGLVDEALLTGREITGDEFGELARLAGVA